MGKTGYFTHSDCKKHEMGPGHPECPERLDAIEDRLLITGVSDALEHFEAPEAALADIELAHTRLHIASLRGLTDWLREEMDAGGPAYTQMDPDTSINVHTWKAALRSAGAAMAATDAVIAGELENAFCAVRPPGHHACRDKAMGFCFFNNVAVAAKYALERHQLKRVAVVDFDVHHGNGTESVFYDDPSVLTVSIHQDQMIYGCGAVEQRGEGAGEGYNLNIPLPPGSGTGAYMAAFERVVIPAVTQFKPDLIVVASGLDAGFSDQTARMLLHSESFRLMTRHTMDLAARLCNGKLVMSHEGGYDPTVSPFLALAIFEELSGIKSSVGASDNPFEGPYTGFVVDQYQALNSQQDEFIRRAEASVALVR